MRFKRVYRAVCEWEEIRYNMWGDSKPGDFEKALRFTSNHKLYGYYMRRVSRRWIASCENALTDYSMNRKAWIGHAAVAMALRIPEEITRKAWRHLTYEQQFLANEEARKAIVLWENAYRKHKQLHSNVAEQVLF